MSQSILYPAELKQLIATGISFIRHRKLLTGLGWFDLIYATLGLLYTFVTLNFAGGVEFTRQIFPLIMNALPLKMSSFKVNWVRFLHAKGTFNQPINFIVPHFRTMFGFIYSLQVRFSILSRPFRRYNFGMACPGKYYVILFPVARFVEGFFIICFCDFRSDKSCFR